MARLRRGRVHYHLLDHRQKILPESGRPALRHPLRGRSHKTDHYRGEQERPGTISRHRKTGFAFILSTVCVFINDTQTSNQIKSKLFVTTYMISSTASEKTTVSTGHKGREKSCADMCPMYEKRNKPIKTTS